MDNDSIDDLEDFDEKAALPETTREFNSTSTFHDMNIDQRLLDAIRKARFENPSPVQSIALSKVLLASDILCQAKSGTGKTAVFVVGILQVLISKPNSTYIVLAHTKELIDQIFEEFKRFSAGLDVSIKNFDEEEVAVDPENASTIDLNRLRPVNFNVLLAPINKTFTVMRTYDLKSVSGLVIDECDAIIGDDVMTKKFERLRFCMDKSIHLMMFTATLSNTAKKKCLSYLQNPFTVLVDDDSKLTLTGLKQYFIESRESDKLKNLVKIIGGTYRNKEEDNTYRRLKYQQIIVFCKETQNALYIEHMLETAQAITPFMGISERIRMLNRFKNGEFKILATTDILSRGIDIQNVDCVFNYDLPADPQTYLHRVGRAGRFETTGTAFSVVNGVEDEVRLNEIMELYEINIEIYEETN